MSYEFFTNGIAREFSKKVNKYLHDDLYEQLVTIYKLLKKRRYTSKKPYVFNDLDNKAWLEKVYNKIDAIILKDQNCDFVIIIKEFSETLHHFVAFSYYADYEEWNKDKIFKKIPILEAIKKVDIYCQYSDNVLENEYVERPNLKYFKNNDVFKENYSFYPLLEIKKDLIKKDKLNKNIITKDIIDKLKEKGFSEEQVQRFIKMQEENEIENIANNEGGVNNLSVFSCLISNIEITEELLSQGTKSEK